MRQTFFLVTKIAISATLLYIALRKVDLGDLWLRLNSGQAAWLVLAVAVALFQIFLAAVRWRKVTAACDAPLTLTQALRFNLIGAFFNQVLPSSIGGDAMRLWLVKKNGAGWRNATYSVFIDRAIGLIALAVFVVASLPWSYKLIADPQGRIALTLIDGLALCAGAGFLLLSRIPLPFLKRWWLTHHPYNCSVIANRLLLNWNSSSKIMALSLSIHLLSPVVAFCVAQSIQAPITFNQILLLVPPVVLITLLPIAIAGWGVRETAMMVAFGYAQLPQTDGINISLLFGAVTFFVGLIGGLVWIVSREKSSRDPRTRPGIDGTPH